jgi:hypothetical protein
VELDIELDWDNEVVGFLDEHRHFVVDDIALACLVVTRHELRVLLSNQLRHEALYAISLDVVFCPTKEFSERVVDLYDLTELHPVSFNNNEACLISDLGARLSKVLLIDLIDLEDALHLANVELVGHGVVEYVELHYRKLKVHLVVFEDLESI